MHLDERSGFVKGQNAEINTDCQMSGWMKPNSWKGNHPKLEINPNTVMPLILLGNCWCTKCKSLEIIWRSLGFWLPRFISLDYLNNNGTIRHNTACIIVSMRYILVSSAVGSNCSPTFTSQTVTPGYPGLVWIKTRIKQKESKFFFTLF